MNRCPGTGSACRANPRIALLVTDSTSDLPFVSESQLKETETGWTISEVAPSAGLARETWHGAVSVVDGKVIGLLLAPKEGPKRIIPLTDALLHHRAACCGAIEEALQTPGGQALIVIERADGTSGHVLNAENVNGNLWLYETYSGQAAPAAARCGRRRDVQPARCPHRGGKPMTIQEARDMVVQKMQPVVEHPLILGCPARLDDASTEEYDWGWLFVFVPTGQELCQRVDQRAKYALDRVTGIATPVGNKGQGKRVISRYPARTTSQ